MSEPSTHHRHQGHSSTNTNRATHASRRGRQRSTGAEQHRPPSAVARPTDNRPHAVLKRLAEVQRQDIQWLWPGRIARGKLTLLCGDPGLGKSLITLDIAARLSRGAAWPEEEEQMEKDHALAEIRRRLDCQAAKTPPPPPAPTPEPIRRKPTSVILLSAEDDVADTIRPRLEALGADLERIVALQAVRRPNSQFLLAGPEVESTFSLRQDIQVLSAAIEQTPSTSLVVIDPLSAYLAGTDTYQNSHVRSLLAPLAKLAADHQVAVLAVTHLNKSVGGPAIYRSVGSLAFAAAARSVWLVTKDRLNPERRLLVPIKNNLASDNNGLAFRLQSQKKNSTNPQKPGADDSKYLPPTVAWAPVAITKSADELLAPDTHDDRLSPERMFAKHWLCEALSGGPLAAREVKRQAHENGVSIGTLRRARADLNIIVRKSSYRGNWEWKLPDEPR